MTNQNIVLTWTKNLPTEPGWYWYRGARSEILEVTREDGRLWVHKGVRCWELDDSWSMSEWAGPVPPPQGCAKKNIHTKDSQ